MIDNNRFEVDFFQLEKLIESCWSGSTILQFCVLQDLIDIQFHKMTDSQRKAIHSFFTTKMTFEKKLYNEDTNEIRDKIIARFDHKFQYLIEGQESEGLHYFYANKYWKDSHTSIDEDFIIIVVGGIRKLVKK